MQLDPMFASEATAARLLDMKPARFRELVEAGHLPPPFLVGGDRRFDVAELRRVIRGELIGGAGDMTW